jgi:PIN domain nuclease of toxin-antitoxin system
MKKICPTLLGILSLWGILIKLNNGKFPIQPKHSEQQY